MPFLPPNQQRQSTEGIKLPHHHQQHNSTTPHTHCTATSQTTHDTDSAQRSSTPPEQYKSTIPHTHTHTTQSHCCGTVSLSHGPHHKTHCTATSQTTHDSDSAQRSFTPPATTQVVNARRNNCGTLHVYYETGTGFTPALKPGVTNGLSTYMSMRSYTDVHPGD